MDSWSEALRNTSTPLIRYSKDAGRYSILLVMCDTLFGKNWKIMQNLKKAEYIAVLTTAIVSSKCVYFCFSDISDKVSFSTFGVILDILTVYLLPFHIFVTVSNAKQCNNLKGVYNSKAQFNAYRRI